MRAPVRLTWMPNGKILVNLPMDDLPLGGIVAGTAVYPSLREFLAAIRVFAPTSSIA
jgi:hypothetical protein